jgi:purine-binding chemotaxis protein CheW
MDKQFLITDNVDVKKYKLYMGFSLEDRLYAAPAESIVEVIKLPMLNIPEYLPEYIVGILNLRGNIINVLDIRSLLGMSLKTYTKEDCILVLNYNDKTWGLIVDSVNNVININLDHISHTPYGTKDRHTIIKSVARTEQGLLAILNLDFISSIVSSADEKVPLEDLKEQYDLPVLQKLSGRVEHTFDSDEKSLEMFQRRAKELQKELSLSLEKERRQDQKFMSFLLNNELYAISLKYIREFSKVINLSLVPCLPEFYIGLSNLRGEFIPVVDIKGFLGISKTPITDKTKIIFTKTNQMQIGIIVDEVFDIINVSSDRINKSAVMQMDKTKYTSGEIILDTNTVINIFDLEKFLQDERLIIEEAV